MDGFALSNSGLADGGGICRDHLGNVIFAFANGYENASNNLAELRVIHDGINLCLDLGLQNVILEFDSSWVVRCFLMNCAPSWKWSYWLTRIVSLVGRGSFRIAHVLREVNGPADSLAKLGSNLQTNRFFPNILPHFSRGQILLDKLGLGAIREHESKPLVHSQV
ncbi:uncharacterized protein LOC131229852 [Magnolia sinica]|uniref:uncharacterized protein LOC131229852 n=1 Tax=Magnolia sinica TaxID=86752 RepID=UPI00265A4566|nr:uncharacterized protein LOC131229852 [Magnolia sinica]